MAQRIKLYNRVPRSYSSGGTAYGSNAEIHSDIVSELEAAAQDIKEVHLALYLFNNAHLYNKLLNVANSGARVIVTSLPLTGYDQRKIGGAKQVYRRVLEDGKVDLRIFPHMYVWYGAEYAGGGASYSFHIKAGLIKYRDGTSKVFLTSGNLAPGDPTHSETAVFIDAPDDSPVIQTFEAFFSETESRTRSFGEYSESVNGLQLDLHQVFDFSFVGSINMVNFDPARISTAFFTAPFITCEGKGSNHYARERLVDVILSAKKRLLLCAQHFHDLSPFNGYRGETIIHSIIKAKKANSSKDVRVLKQVASSGLADKRRAAFVEAHLYNAGIPQKVNKLAHDKFIVADNAVVITTGNFTATQFGWGDRQMEYKTDTGNLGAVQNVIESAQDFFATPKGYVRTQMTRPRSGLAKVKVFKNDVFSEVNAFIILEGSEIANQLAAYFDTLWNHDLSADIKVPT